MRQGHRARGGAPARAAAPLANAGERNQVRNTVHSSCLGAMAKLIRGWVGGGRGGGGDAWAAGPGSRDVSSECVGLERRGASMLGQATLVAGSSMRLTCMRQPAPEPFLLGSASLAAALGSPMGWPACWQARCGCTAPCQPGGAAPLPCHSACSPACCASTWAGASWQVLEQADLHWRVAPAACTGLAAARVPPASPPKTTVIIRQPCPIIRGGGVTPQRPQPPAPAARCWLRARLR